MRNKKWIIYINLLIILAVASAMIIKKEKTIKHGQIILLELYGNDPRSLMQGDYMSLSYQIEADKRAENSEEMNARGYYLLERDSNRVVHYLGCENEKPQVDSNQVILKYYNYGDFGGESYFFEEGSGDDFATARYGGFKIDTGGNPVLVGLYDDKFRILPLEK